MKQDREKPSKARIDKGKPSGANKSEPELPSRVKIFQKQNQYKIKAETKPIQKSLQQQYQKN
jgi:hypothetical protein